MASHNTLIRAEMSLVLNAEFDPIQICPVLQITLSLLYFFIMLFIKFYIDVEHGLEIIINPVSIPTLLF